MKASNIFKKASIAFVGLIAAFAMVGSPSTSAIPYSGDSTPAAPSPMFNVFTGVPVTGNESDFLRARTAGATTDFADPLNAACTDGQVIDMRVYVHNGADQAKNASGESIARNTKVKVSLPTVEATSFNPSATISSSNAGTVNDGLTINCGSKKVKLSYVAGSANQFSKNSGVQALSDSIVTDGAAIGTNRPDGNVLGCWDQRVYVVLKVKVSVTPPPVEEQPATGTCDLLNVVASDNRKVKVSQFAYTNTKSTIKSVTLNWGDKSDTVTTTDATKINGLEHQYNMDGTYNIVATITFAVAGKADIVSGGAGTACAKPVAYTSNGTPTPPTTTTTTPGTPTTLVNTGAGSVMGMFAAATAVGYVAYRKVLGRRLSN